MFPNVCCICLEARGELKTINLEDDSSLKLSIKLDFVAPKLEWLEIFSLCFQCNEHLDIAYNFKRLCLKTESSRLAFSKFACEDNNKSPDESQQLSSADEDEAKSSDLSLIQSQTEFKCYHCLKMFKSKELLETHIKSKHEKACKTCGNIFKTHKELLSHRKVQHIRQKRSAKLQCDICGEHFALLKSILQHSTDIHLLNKKDVKPYCCDQCKNKFSTSALLIQHKKYHNGERAFTCTICGKSFKTKRDLNGHEKLHVNEKKYSCDKCPKSFNTNPNLKTHMYVVHTDPSKWKYSCSICGKRFAMKSNCSEHVKRHEGSKAFECHICRKMFVSNYEVKKHVKLHSNIAFFQCPECLKHYRDKRSFDTHLYKMHGVGAKKPPTRVKKFVCHMCPSQFFENQKLQRHIRGHTGLKPFSCLECEKRFTDKTYLASHLKNVHSIKCSVVKKELSDIDELYF